MTTNVGGTLPTSVADPRESYEGIEASRQPGSSVPHALLPGSTFPCLSCRLVGACGGFVRGCVNYYRDEGMRP